MPTYGHPQLEVLQLIIAIIIIKTKRRNNIKYLLFIRGYFFYHFFHKINPKSSISQLLD